ncbi:MAG: hypothetical protein PUC47_05185 [Oscillospiraceae bacterium]|nr:hypothetical protein [Oscillospiraceae bacterium]
MKLFHHRKQVLPLPPGCTPADIATSSSVCTGETLIGFRLPSGELAGAVLCRNEEDRRAFYRSYGLSPDDK